MLTPHNFLFLLLLFFLTTTSCSKDEVTFEPAEKQTSTKEEEVPPTLETEAKTSVVISHPAAVSGTKETNKPNKPLKFFSSQNKPEEESLVPEQTNSSNPPYLKDPIYQPKQITNVTNTSPLTTDPAPLPATQPKVTLPPRPRKTLKQLVRKTQPPQEELPLTTPAYLRAPLSRPEERKRKVGDTPIVSPTPVQPDMDFSNKPLPKPKVSFTTTVTIKHKETFTAPKIELKKIDIVFIADNSRSLQPHVNKGMAPNIKLLFSPLNQFDWQLAHLNTDALAGPGKPGFSGEFSFFNSAEGESLRFLKKGDSKASQKLINKIKEQDSRGIILQNVTRNPLYSEYITLEGESVLRNGQYSSSYEQPLKVLLQSVDKSTFGNVNYGFYREGAELIVIMMTDEDEMSHGGPFATKANDVAQSLRSTWPKKKISAYGIVADETCFKKQNKQKTEGHQIVGDEAVLGEQIIKLTQLDDTKGKTMSLCSSYGKGLTLLAQHAEKKTKAFEFELKEEAPIKDSIRVEFSTGTPKRWELKGKTVLFPDSLDEEESVTIYYATKKQVTTSKE